MKRHELPTGQQIKRWMIVAVSSLLLGCSNANIKTPLTPFEQSQRSVQETVQTSSMLPEIVLPQIEEKQAKPKSFSLAVKDMDIRSVLKVFIDSSELSLVIDQDVQGKVTVDLKQVSLEQLLFYVLEPLNLDYVRDGNVLYISTRKLKTRIFMVNYLASKRSTSGSISISGSNEKSSSSGSISSSNEFDFWTKLEAQLQVLVAQSDMTEDEKHKPELLINRGSGVVLVRATPKVLHQIEQFLDLVGDASRRQVRIEAKIVEVTLNDENRFGINWERMSEVFPDRLFGSDVSVSAASGFQLAPGTPGGVFATFASERTNAVLQALKKQGNVQVLSSPSISTLNNQPALIKVAQEKVAFVVKTELQTSGVGAESVTTKTTEAEIKKVTDGLSLRVTPNISRNGMIIMDVHPVITKLERFENITDDLGQRIGVEPVVNVREINAILKARSGESVIMGGLMEESNSKEKTKVPFLGSIPVMGALFQSQVDVKTKKELVIFITPTLLDEENGVALVEQKKFSLQKGFPGVWENK
ncbi:MAG: secretin and TonB N-terminal domain-containing protein [SAR324 cluster bacterium]|nr:secretin and TonB N-terminal domain-containing protein [SAR324 cluster bacterium]